MNKKKKEEKKIRKGKPEKESIRKEDRIRKERNMKYYGGKRQEKHKKNSKLDKKTVLDPFLKLSEARHLVCRFLVCSDKQPTVCGSVCWDWLSLGKTKLHLKASFTITGPRGRSANSPRVPWTISTCSSQVDDCLA